jgi:hypothetical protein
MRSPAWAIGWQLWRPHRAVLAKFLAAMLFAGILSHFLPGATMGSEELAVVTLLATGSAILLSALIVFTFTTEGTDLASTRSTFPARMFTLPVRARALVGWPMLHGTVFVAGGWVVLAGVVRAWSGAQVAMWSPALGLAAFLAWAQAIAWCPFPLPWLRVIAMGSLLLGLIVAIIMAMVHPLPEALLVLAFGGLVAGAYFTALAGVARARQGAGMGWQLLPKGAAQPGHRAARDRSFASAAWAQVWYEWRRNWVGLPLCALLLVAALALVLWFGKKYEVAFQELERADGLPPQLRMAFLSVLGLIPLLAAGVGLSLGATGGTGGKDIVLPAFQGVRPMSAAIFVAAKLEAGFWITLVCWGVVVLVLPLVVLATGTWGPTLGWALDCLQQQGPVKACVLVVVAATLLIGGTWVSMGSTMCFSLTGRAWIVKTVVLTAVLLLLCIPVVLSWVVKHREHHAALESLLPWVLSGLVALKMVLGWWVVRSVRSGGAIADRGLAGILMAWAVAAAGLVGLVGWLVPEGLAPWYLLVLGVVLLMPLNRLLAAPLALSWNRHR